MEILAIFPKEVIRSLFICTLSLFLKYNNKRVLFSYFSTNSYIVRYTEPDPSYPVCFALKRNVYIFWKKKKEKRVQNHNIPRDISKFVGKKRKISQTYHYSLLFFIINPIYKKEIASNSRSNLFRVKKERQREREFPLQSLSESRSIKEYSVLNRYPEDKLEKILS